MSNLGGGWGGDLREDAEDVEIERRACRKGALFVLILGVLILTVLVTLV